MSLKAFYAALLWVLAAVIVLSVGWEFWIEDRLMENFVSYHEKESLEERWEFVASTGFFSFLALIGPAIIGSRMIRRHQALHQSYIQLSQEDSLTGLYNRRRLTELLENEIRRGARYKSSFSVILMDMDNFKAVNDQFGHQAGDEVLVKVAEFVRSKVRATDMAGRWGGEEFVIILPETDINGALSLADKIRTQIASADLAEIGHQTASFGVTAYADGDDINSIIARADAGLYLAKEGGKNQVAKVLSGV